MASNSWVAGMTRRLAREGRKNSNLSYKEKTNGERAIKCGYSTRANEADGQQAYDEVSEDHWSLRRSLRNDAQLGKHGHMDLEAQYLVGVPSLLPYEEYAIRRIPRRFDLRAYSSVYQGVEGLGRLGGYTLQDQGRFV